MDYWVCGTCFYVFLLRFSQYNWFELTSLPYASWRHWQSCTINTCMYFTCSISPLIFSTEEIAYTFIHRTDNGHWIYRCPNSKLHFFGFLWDVICENFIWRTYIDILTMGKCYPVSRLSEHNTKLQITHVEHYRDSDNLFSIKSFSLCSLTILVSQ